LFYDTAERFWGLEKIPPRGGRKKRTRAANWQKHIVRSNREQGRKSGAEDEAPSRRKNGSSAIRNKRWGLCAAFRGRRGARSGKSEVVIPAKIKKISMEQYAAGLNTRKKIKMGPSDDLA